MEFLVSERDRIIGKMITTEVGTDDYSALLQELEWINERIKELQQEEDRIEAKAQQEEKSKAEAVDTWWNRGIQIGGIIFKTTVDNLVSMAMTKWIIGVDLTGSVSPNKIAQALRDVKVKK